VLNLKNRFPQKLSVNDSNVKLQLLRS
jgi:hypothetical protein